ncbi:pyridine nucleotide-disulfide oxidoreductase [Mycobacterium sp. 852013-51886_SCH5428379]|uniref:flavin-containing monooxygenase n=1 Tax=Mycobacterium sp. 852013-51886_SCH5428379 TaxID=1834111 RepID=UPI0007FD7A21|nr:NAD(P)/FAD-dependent oxidoreductase [Mycobacterium sp. 852013-51886_SCH5428379]OBB58216.1 pyridine nucleotide-disulfide oxidoreductase [Mycobacterium sp. 852013-51886_SCH5428379]
MGTDLHDEDVIVVGAGPCGLAIARQLRHERGIDALVVDRAHAPASSWRRRHDGFRLNTCGFWSHLPGQRIPRRHGRWPGRDAIVGYLDDYVRRQDLRLQLGVTVVRVDGDDGRWLVTTEDGAVHARAVIVATGNYHTPALPPWPGMDGFTGEILHSADYRNPWPFVGRDVLVVGPGNSGTDIAVQLTGVAERVRMAVRTPPHLVPRSTAGLPIDAATPVLRRLPVAVLDRAAAVLQRARFGDLSSHGVPAPGKGIYRALLDDGHVPTIGDQLVARIRDGRIGVVPAVESFDADKIVLADESRVTADVVIAATGYHPGLEPLVGHLGVLDTHGHPSVNGLPCAAPGLWFAGYDEPLIGPLRSYRLQAGPIAADVARYLTR